MAFPFPRHQREPPLSAHVRHPWAGGGQVRKREDEAKERVRDFKYEKAITVSHTQKEINLDGRWMASCASARGQCATKAGGLKPENWWDSFYLNFWYFFAKYTVAMFSISCFSSRKWRPWTPARTCHTLLADPAPQTPGQQSSHVPRPRHLWPVWHTDENIYRK